MSAQKLGDMNLEDYLHIMRKKAPRRRRPLRAVAAGTAFVLAARFSPSPSQMALMAGFMLQGAGIGQTIGPLMVSSIVEYAASWNAANLVVITLAGIGLTSALVLRQRS